MKRLWTEEEVEILKKYYPLIDSDLSIEELGEILNRTHDSIRRKAHNLDLKVEYKSNINYDLLKQLSERVKI